MLSTEPRYLFCVNQNFSTSVFNLYIFKLFYISLQMKDKTHICYKRFKWALESIQFIIWDDDKYIVFAIII